ncbi:MAG: hypothetical protein IT368_09860 [Candidatus Hydrogenedentes bacterium]|nr:hypothetical protein [Candidatus Hydrogenedentota bacterium]
MKSCSLLLSLLCLIAAAGCVTTRGPVKPAALPEGAPEAAEILLALAQNDGQIQNFKGTGTLILESPEFAATQVLRQSAITYAVPDFLAISGRKHGTLVFDLTSAGDAFLIELPTERDYYYRIEGEQFKEVPFSVAPGEIAREMFLPRLWQAVGNTAVLADWQPATQTAVLLIDSGQFPVRRVQVTGPPWVVTRSELLNEAGEIIAVTTREDYRDIAGVRFPGKVVAAFPGEQAMMSLAFRDIAINVSLDESTFDVTAKARAVQQYLQQEFGIDR